MICMSSVNLVGNAAQRWISKYLTLIDKSKQSRPDLQCGWILNQIPKITRTDREEFFIKELHLYHYTKIQTEGSTPNALDLELSLLSALERIGGRPGSLVIGTNYGWQEGLKSSARETAMDNGTSLWTFLDLYEFLVRTDDWNIEDRQQAFIDILAKDGGPVCWEIAKL